MCTFERKKKTPTNSNPFGPVLRKYNMNLNDMIIKKSYNHWCRKKKSRLIHGSRSVNIVIFIDWLNVHGVCKMNNFQPIET